MTEGRVHTPFKRLGMCIGFGVSAGIGMMVDFDSGKLATFTNFNIGGGVGAYIGAGMTVGWYPNAEIEDIAGFGYNLGFVGSKSTFNVGAEINFTTDTSAKNLSEFWENMKVGGNYTPTGLSRGKGGVVYVELGYLKLSRVLDFKEASLNDLTNALNSLGLNIESDEETFKILQQYFEMWFKKNEDDE